MRILGLGQVVLAFLVVLGSSEAVAGDDPFSSDRPGFANTTGIAPKLGLITEFGLDTAPFEDAPFVSFPSASFRLGLMEGLELRWRAPQLVFARAQDKNGKPHYTVNLADPVLGFKVGTQLHRVVALSSTSEVSLPLGTGGMEAARAGWSTDLNVDFYVAPRFTLTPNTVLASEWTGGVNQGGRRMALAVSLAGFFQVSPKLSAFTLLYSQFRNRQPRNLVLGMGTAWRLRQFAQLDASVYLPVVKGSESVTLGVGATIYWQGLKAARSRQRLAGQYPE